MVLAGAGHQIQRAGHSLIPAVRGWELPTTSPALGENSECYRCTSR